MFWKRLRQTYSHSMSGLIPLSGYLITKDPVSKSVLCRPVTHMLGVGCPNFCWDRRVGGSVQTTWPCKQRFFRCTVSTAVSMHYGSFLHNERVCMFLSLLRMNFSLHQLIVTIPLPLVKVSNLFLICNHYHWICFPIVFTVSWFLSGKKLQGQLLSSTFIEACFARGIAVLLHS